MSPPPLDAEKWTAEEEMELVAMQSAHVNMVDTALGVSTIQMANAVSNNFSDLPIENRNSLKRAIEALEAQEALEASADPDGTTGTL